MLILKIKKRYFLKKKKVKEIKSELGDYGSFINNKDTLELLEAEDYDFILVNGEPYIIMINDEPYPTVKAALNMELDSKVVVIIVEETHNKPLAIGISLITGPEMVENSEGKAIKNIHYVGDAIWNLEL